jgi:parallel beta-helix repeat protein
MQTAMTHTAANDASKEPRRHRRLAAAALAATVAFTGLATMTQMPAAAAAPVPGTCTLWASPTGNDANPGTSAAPFRTLSRLDNAMTPGSVGCLKTGTYSPGGGVDGITLTKGGTALAPATIRNEPGAAAQFDGRIVIGASASNLVIAGLALNGVSTSSSEASSVTIDADNVTLVGNDITAPTRICVSGGSSRTITGLVLEGNRVHHCGDGLPRARQEHGIYLQQTRGAIVRNNLIDRNNTRGLQLFYDADGTLVENNVIDHNGDDGINIGGKRADDGTIYRSQTNTFRNNIVSTNGLWNVETYFDETLPVSGDLGNVFSNNCFFGADASRSVASSVGVRVDATNRWVNPQFSSASTGDYRLLATSPCLGKGMRASTIPKTVRAITTTAATFDAAIRPNRMTHNVFVRVRSCNDVACTVVGPWITSASAPVVGMVDTPVSRSISGLTPNTRYQVQWVTHQALLPATNPAALVVTTATTFTTAT